MYVRTRRLELLLGLVALLVVVGEALLHDRSRGPAKRLHNDVGGGFANLAERVDAAHEVVILAVPDDVHSAPSAEGMIAAQEEEPAVAGEFALVAFEHLEVRRGMIE